MLAAYRRALAPFLTRAFPWIFTGRKHLPAHDSYVVVANHSGLGTVEALLLAEVWEREVGGGRRIAPMAHPAMLRSPAVGGFLRRFGAVEATRAGAAWARANDAALLLFPGGDHESMRPFWRPKTVDFAGRTGWIRLAREHGLTIVPMAVTGTHVTAPTLGYSKALAYLSGARLLGVRRVPLSIAGLSASLAYLALSREPRRSLRAAKAALAFAATFAIPWIPSRVGFHLLPPIQVGELTQPDDEIYARVTSAIERVLVSEPVSTPVEAL